jgi:hypothetical protein
MRVEELSYRRSQICKQQNGRIKPDALCCQPGKVAKPAGEPVRKPQEAVMVRAGRRYRNGFPGGIDFRAIVHRQPVPVGSTQYAILLGQGKQRLAGYEDVGDAERLSRDPTFRLIGSREISERGAVLTSRL